MINSKLVKILFFILLAGVAATKGIPFLERDSCHDSGGAWNTEYDFCYFHEAGAADLVTVNKSKKIMTLSKNGEVIRTFSIVFGANPVGHKQQEGDERTPEGSYILDYKKEDSSFYRSMHINYPNENDIEVAKKKGVSPGGFIMVHGQRNWLGWLSPIMQRFNWTDGCIAITNSEMDEFMFLVPVNSEIIIVP